jgi:hypothetical protein
MPVFLDPIKITDVALVAYNETGGMSHSADALSEEEKYRVRLTNELFGLSAHPPLVEARQRIWRECRGIIADIEALKAEDRENGGTATSRTLASRESLMKRLRDKTRNSEPFSSVARNCLLVSGYAWAATIAVSQP